MSHGRHARPGLASKAAKNINTGTASGMMAGVLLTGVPGSVALHHTVRVTAAQPRLTAVDKKASAEVYTVQPGDYLSAIAQDHCGNPDDWTGLYEANRKVIGGNPNLIYAGEKLVLDCRTAKVTPSAGTDAITPSDNLSSMANALSGQGYDGWAMAATALFLVQHGYTRIATAGIISCIAGESGGNPESVGDGGGGLIGWTPLPYGYVTGDASADLQTQLNGLLAYNNANGSVAILNTMTDPLAAADYYSEVFERPAVTDSDVVSWVAYTVYTYL